MELLEALASTLKEFRSQKKLTQEKLAELSGLHVTFIGRVEIADKEIRLSSILKIADGLGIAPGEFVKRVSEKMGRVIGQTTEREKGYFELSKLKKDYNESVSKFVDTVLRQESIDASMRSIITHAIMTDRDKLNYESFQKLIERLSE